LDARCFSARMNFWRARLRSDALTSSHGYSTRFEDGASGVAAGGDAGGSV
jgi:hypothetical protein